MVETASIRVGDAARGNHRFVERFDDRLLKPLLDKVESGEFDPSFVISHRVPIHQAPQMYKTFRVKQDNCTKVVLDSVGRRRTGSLIASIKGERKNVWFEV